MLPLAAVFFYFARNEKKIFAARVSPGAGEFLLMALILAMVCLGFAFLNHLMDQEKAKKG
jgi:hypothetical protein